MGEMERLLYEELQLSGAFRRDVLTPLPFSGFAKTHRRFSGDNWREALKSVITMEYAGTTCLPWYKGCSSKTCS